MTGREQHETVLARHLGVLGEPDLLAQLQAPSECVGQHDQGTLGDQLGQGTFGLGVPDEEVHGAAPAAHRGSAAGTRTGSTPLQPSEQQ